MTASYLDLYSASFFLSSSTLASGALLTKLGFESIPSLIDIVKGIRNIRAVYTIKNKVEVKYTIETKEVFFFF